MLSKEREYKVVIPDKFNTDEYLVSFLSEENINDYQLKEREIIKPTDPSKIVDKVFTDYSHYARALMEDSEYERVMKSDAWAEINCNMLMCAADTYYALSKLIHKDYTIIDFGCGYNAQSYFFQEHQRYIGINPEFKDEHFKLEKFQAPGTDFYDMTGQQFLSDVLPTLNLKKEKTFAMCLWVPDFELYSLVQKEFRYAHTFYPQTF